MPTPVGEAPPHGTRARYVSRTSPCRCEQCRRANAAGIQAWRHTGSTLRTVDEAAPFLDQTPA